MSGGSKTKTQTTTVNSAPWVGVQPYLTQSYGQYQNYINNPSPTPARNNAIDTLFRSTLPHGERLASI